jgi:dTDP-4-amino-4,6-dideoxygalactose transaminase
MAATVRLVDLAAQHRAVAAEVDEAWADILERADFVAGDTVARFERAFAAWTGVAHCVGVASGTDALELAFRAAGVGPGHEVVVPTNSFFATAAAVVRAGATPRLADVDPDSLLLDANTAAAHVTDRTRAIVPVHLYGQMADVDAFAALGRRTGTAVIEDAAQSHGATSDGAPPGARTFAAATSFYPGKNLGAYGDGGAVLTTSTRVAAEVRALGNHGSTCKYAHPQMGFNSRLDTLQAAVLLAKLTRLDAWNAARERAAFRYDELLAGLPVTRPATVTGNRHAWHLYVIRTPRRDAVRAALHDAGVETGIHYPVPIHLQGAFRHLGHGRGDFPVAERAAGEILSLPLHPFITQADQERVAAAVSRALS